MLNIKMVDEEAAAVLNPVISTTAATANPVEVNRPIRGKGASYDTVGITNVSSIPNFFYFFCHTFLSNTFFY